MISGGVPMRREDAVPGAYLVARHAACGDRRHVRQIAQPRSPGSREREDLVVEQRALHRSVEIDHELHVVAQQRDDDVRRAAIGNDLEIQAGRAT